MLLMLQEGTTIIIDWGAIVQSVISGLIVLIPVIGGLIKIHKQGKDTHVLVNDQLTRTKAQHLLDLRTNREVLEIAMDNSGKPRTDNQTAVLRHLDLQIKGLSQEIRQRDVAAGTLLAEPPADKKQRSSDILPGGSRAYDPPKNGET